MGRVAVLCLMLLPSGCASFSPITPWERAMVFPRSQYPTGDWRPAGIAVEDAWFAAADGTRLHGWYLPAARPETAGVALFAHGNGGNVTDWVHAAARLRDEMNWSVLVFDYRGYGRSAGAPSEAGVLQDARAARAWLAQRAGVPEAAIVLVGRSLGGGVMGDLAATDGAAALVLQSTFTSLPDVASSLVPLLPARLVMHSRFDTLSKIDRYRGPVFISHGDADELIPHAHAERLLAACRGPKELYSLRGGGHNDPLPDEYYAALRKFLGEMHDERRVGTQREATPLSVAPLQSAPCPGSPPS